jgi:hypothetical protein
LIYMIVLLPVPHCFDYYGFVLGNASLTTLFFFKVFFLFVYLSGFFGSSVP